MVLGHKTVAEIPQDNQKIRMSCKNRKEFLEFIGALIRENFNGNHQGKLKQQRGVFILYESVVVESHLHQNDWPIREAKEMCSQIIT